MDREAGALVSAAALQTIRGAAQVTLSFGMSVPEFETTAELVGVVDFDADRCRLDRQSDEAAAAMAFEGPVSYMRRADGRWTWTKGASGTHSMFDPRWVLEALAHAQGSAVATDARAVEVARDNAQRRHRYRIEPRLAPKQQRAPAERGPVTSSPPAP